MSSLSQTIRVGLFFIFGLSLIWIVYETFSESNLYTQKGYDLKAPFGDIKQLKRGADVRLAGVSIGSVTEMTLIGKNAVVLINIEDNYRIPEDSIAMITTAGLLGSNYVSIDIGSSKKMLKPGAIIKTRATPDINEVISSVGNIGDKIENLITDLTGDEGGELFGSVNDLAEEIRPKLDRILTNMEKVSGKLATQSGTLGKLIHSEEAYDRFLIAVDRIDQAAADASNFMQEGRSLFAKIDSKKGALGVLMHDPQIAADIKESIANFNQFSERLNNTNSTLGRLLTDDELYVQAEDILNKVDGAVDSVENSGPITAVGVVAGALF